MSAPNPTDSSAPTVPPGMAALTELAMDLRWSWCHFSDDLWRSLDPELWEETPHPNFVLRSVSRERLANALADPTFCNRLESLVAAKRQAAASPAWFQQTYPTCELTCVAYFCMEFMLSEALPIYSGGLGNVAGDQLKAASDLGVPVVGVGLLYQQGYFRQAIDKDGRQLALYPTNAPEQLPITRVLSPSGEPLRIEVRLPGGSVWICVWHAQVGRRSLYLLDTNDPENSPAHRGITSELYGGNPELRLQQEMVLGIGGWRALAALGLKPEVCHLNEGHAAFALLERARSFMRDTGKSFNVALTATRSGNLFTTHTAVPAGFDVFPPALVEQYFAQYASDLGIGMRGLLALGRVDADNPSEPFNMAYLALRGSGAVNGVSELHGRVSRKIFGTLFPRWPEDSVPIGHVTNGVHMPTWDSAGSDALWTEACGKGRWLGMSATVEADIRRVSDEKLWTLRNDSRGLLVAYARKKLAQQLVASGTGPAASAQMLSRLRPDVLTLGFARRFATYKRPNLLLHDPERLTRILRNPARPAQLILAGKAHPADLAGQALIQDWMQFVRGDRNPPVVFLVDYDMLLGEHLVQGVDVWINTPRRPWEACGTSGMKILVNGGLNLSELDGWWAEAYSADVGWAIGDGEEHGEDAAWDSVDAEALYERLEQEVIPEFHARNKAGVPARWVARIRESMAGLTPRFAANRTVREYTEKHYLPAAAGFLSRASHQGALAQGLANWQQEVAAKWPTLRFGVESAIAKGEKQVITAETFLGAVAADAIRVELYAIGVNGGGAERHPMTLLADTTSGNGGRVYSATISSARPATDYTAQILPNRDGLCVPLEANEILWQR